MENKIKNKDYNPFNCGVTHFLNIVDGKRKVLVIYGISKKMQPFQYASESDPQISKQILINQLRELEEDGLVARVIFAEVPPRVEYKLTDYGTSMMPLIFDIQKWGEKDLKNKGKLTEK